MKSEPPEDFRPAIGTPASPSFGEKSDETVDLHIGMWKDGRWSYLFGEDTAYRAEMPDIEAIRSAAREAREGELPEIWAAAGAAALALGAGLLAAVFGGRR